jgi:hypothetical protein
LFKSSLTRNERVAAQGCDFCGLELTPSRILEKQNSLQMSQIFSRSRTLVFRSFCFSRILQAGPRNPKVLNSKTSSISEHESKPKCDMAIASGDLPGPLTFTKFGPAKARPLRHVDAAPNSTLIPLNLAVLRRGLARLTASGFERNLVSGERKRRIAKNGTELQRAVSLPPSEAGKRAA